MERIKRTRLIKQRRNKGLSQSKVANMAQISRTYYTSIELGYKNPSLPVAKRIANVLETDIDIFFNDDVSFRNTGTE